MDSSPPPPASQEGKKLRPWYLAVAMVLTWLVAVSGLMSGCSTIMVLQQNSVVDVAAELGKQDAGDPLQALWVAIYAAQFNATIEAYAVTFPLNAAKLILSGLLVVASVLAMGGRPGGRALALQAILANAAFAALDYALTRSVRASWIETVGGLGDSLPRPLLRRDAIGQEELMLFITDRRVWWWFERARILVVEVGIFGFALLALTRERTKRFFEAVRAAADRARDP